MSVSLQQCLGGSHEMGKQRERAFCLAKRSLTYSTGGKQNPHYCAPVWTQRTSGVVLSDFLFLLVDYEAPVQKD